jgi:hemerythrin-like domain-containing protein
MFKTVLQQQSFQEIVKFLNDFSTAHHTKSKDEYVARIVSPENMKTSDSEWDCYCNQRLKTTF